MAGMYMSRVSWPTVIATLVILALLGMALPGVRQRITGDGG